MNGHHDFGKRVQTPSNQACQKEVQMRATAQLDAEDGMRENGQLNAAGWIE